MARTKKVNWEVMGEIVDRNTAVDQFEILVDELPVLDDVNLEATQIGVAKKGIYNLKEFIRLDPCRFFKLESHKWVCGKPEEIALHLRKKKGLFASIADFFKTLFK